MQWPEDPDIAFDAQGVCNYCHFANSQANARRVAINELPWLIHQIKKDGRGRKADCLVGLSGGVDSSMVLDKVVTQGLRPLTFTVDNGWNTEQSDENIMRLVETLKVPFFRYTINLEVFHELQRAFILAGVKNIEIPTDHILLATTYKMAKEYGVKWIIGGGNWQTEGTMPLSYGYQPRDLTHIKAIYKQLTGKKLTVLVTISLLEYLYYRNIKRIRVVNLLDYYKYNREEAKKYLMAQYGWRDYGEKHHESMFTEWFQSWYLPTKFGIDKRRPHYSSLIHSKQMTRDEAVHLLAIKPRVRNLVHKNIERVLGLTQQEIEALPKHEYSDYPTNEYWWNAWMTFFKLLRPLGWQR